MVAARGNLWTGARPCCRVRLRIVLGRLCERRAGALGAKEVERLAQADNHIASAERVSKQILEVHSVDVDRPAKSSVATASTLHLCGANVGPLPSRCSSVVRAPPRDREHD
jgi:hypothetical protein